MFKNQLGEYAQKPGLAAPIYDIKIEGPCHEPQFKASVIIDGLSTTTSERHAATEVALVALGKPKIGQLHESGPCKNLLQEYAQKCKLPLPVYSVVQTGEVHSPMFSATVDIAGVHYNGGKCKFKKEAEIQAAKAALVANFADSGPSYLDAAEDQAADAVEDQGNTRLRYIEQTTDAEVVNNNGAEVDNSDHLQKHPVISLHKSPSKRFVNKSW
ncbi:hypothetical protein GOP47_0001678 [Adiantum capillus-veneris]|uniref:DRBM domain-containing protein n=1 Tax=Adiantum capillus-veneris TaxID=13818 RepID=A0A9D4V9H3_ADICA|nr:hypothetical protein GOP47_0001678 [Adiantum capillus-veneris]